MNESEVMRDKSVRSVSRERGEGNTRSPAWPVSLSILLAAIAGVARLGFTMGQDINWDLRNYHFYNVYAFLHDRLWVDVAPAMIQSYLNPLLDLLPYTIINNLPPYWLGIILGGIQGINIWLVFLIAYLVLDTFQDPWRCGLALLPAVLGFYGAISVSEIGTTLQDTVISIFILAGLLIFMRSLTGNETSLKKRITGFFLAGLAMGLGTGFKITAAIYLIGLAPAFLFRASHWSGRVKHFAIWCLGALLGIATTGGYWMVILYREFQNPLFPFYNALFQSPYFNVMNFSDDRFFPRNVCQTLFYPFYFGPQNIVTEPAFRDYRFAIIYILLGILILGSVIRRLKVNTPIPVRDSTRTVGTALTIFFVTSYIAWQILFSIYRYLAPLEMLSFVIIFILISRLSTNRWVPVTSTLLIGVLVIATIQIPTWGRKTWDSSYFGVEVPSVPDLESALVMIPSYVPLAYTIPFFPDTVRFIRIEGTFYTPLTSNGMTAVVWDAINSHPGDLYVLMRDSYIDIVPPVLKSFNLELNPDSVYPIKSSIESGLILQKVQSTI